jgi:hypothetical protein
LNEKTKKIHNLPILACFTLSHTDIRVVRHFTFVVPTRNRKTQGISLKTHPGGRQIETPRGEKQSENFTTYLADLHSHPIGNEPSSCSVVFKVEEIVFRADAIQFGVFLESMHTTFSLNCIDALLIEMIQKEELLCVVELATTSYRLLRSIIPPHTDLQKASPTIVFYLLHPSYVQWLLGILGIQHASQFPTKEAIF